MSSRGPGSRKNNPEFERTVGPNGGVGYRRKNKAVGDVERSSLGDPVSSSLEDDVWEDGPLEELQLRHQRSSIRTLIDPGLRDDPTTGMILDPPYQRGAVWGTERKQNLIRSLLRGVPVGAIVINDRWESGMEADPNKMSTAVVDGKQRITAIQDFSDGKYTVPRSWWADEYVSEEAQGEDSIAYDQLSTLGKRHFRGLGVPVVCAQVSTIEEEEELFGLINYGGVPQGESDI